MKFHSLPLAASVLLCGCVGASAFQTPGSATKSPMDYVNTLVGTAPLDDPKVIGNAPPPGEELYTGITSPGAVLPHGMMNLAPINKNLDLSYGAGIGMSYDYIHPTMLGFSTGAPNLSVMPVVGDWTVPPERSASWYDKAREHGTPGYYSVYLNDYRTTAELTVTHATGMLRFAFPQSEKSHLVMDLGRGGGNIEIVDDHTIRGTSGRGRRGGGGRAWVAILSRPFTKCGTFHYDLPQPTDRADRPPSFNGNTVTNGGKSDSGPYAGVYLRFSTTEGEQVLMKVASGATYEDAQKTLDAENPAWDFDGIHRAAIAAWAPKMNAIQVKGGTEHQRMLFYSNLFHSYASPRIIARKGDIVPSRDGTAAVSEYTRYNEVPFWDTGRDQITLLTLLEPDVMVDIMRSTLDQAKDAGGWMPTSFHGDNAVWMFLGSWLRGVPFDYASAWPAIAKNAATDPGGSGHGRPYLAEYMQNGWISDFIPQGNPSPPYADGKAGAATTLEYSWDDWAVAQYAKKLGKTADYQTFIKRAGNYKNVFDPSVGFMRGRTADGAWISPFDPQEPYYNFMMKEASGWSTLWLVPHDVKGLIGLLGGRDAFNAKLDAFFSTPYNPVGDCRDCTGMVGQYVQGNQPDQQAAFFYDWSGQPWKTQAVVRQILATTYGSDKYGIGFPGMDDQGSTSSWYVFGALGFFPVNPASDVYAIDSPIFDEATVHMGNGKDFTITARNNSETNKYIQSATLNGKPLNRPWFRHAEIANGGRLEFVMGPEPNKTWGASPEAAPPSMSDTP